MRLTYFHTLFFLCCFCSTLALSAQGPATGKTADLTPHVFPRQDNARLLAAELAARVPGRAPHFAQPLKTDLRPTNAGQWRELGNGTSSWRLRLQSPGAESLNLGFTEYWMPGGGVLYLYSGSEKDPDLLGPFTPADNEIHDQLWTPLLPGDDLVVEVILPTEERENLRLKLTSVNHDFLGLGKANDKSGSCNLDVVCDAADGWEIVDLYRDIIRSVAVISTGGGTFCTGFLVNNARQDGTPFFMTADHCGIGAGNAPSLVTYWNFENSNCRQPNSGASGGNGNGQLNDFNTGAIWRASNPASDMTIVELDDPVSPTANAFFAGWSNDPTAPGDTVIGIHHPRTDEKRISFSFGDVFRASYNSTNPSANGNHITILDWDIGTTEPGSSGSPFFDRFHRVRGQLHGGFAACGNDLQDSYGFFHTSWEGGGTPSTRLRDWLDPDDTGIVEIDGIDQSETNFSLGAVPAAAQVCSGNAATYTITVGGAFTENLTMVIEDLPAGLTATYSQNPAAPGSTVTLTVAAPTAAPGNYDFTLEGTGDGRSPNVALSLEVLATAPAAPSGTAPDPATAQNPTSVRLEWMPNATADSYDYQVSTSNDLSNPLTDLSTTAQSATLENLGPNTTYYWRVRANSICGAGNWSSIRSFSTTSLACGGNNVSVNVPVEITPVGTPTISSDLNVSEFISISYLVLDVRIKHTYVGDLELRLTNPDGITVTLVDRIAGGSCNGDDLVLRFRDDAPNTAADLQAACNNLPAASGDFQPLESFSAYDGENSFGEWTLTVDDQAGADGGALMSWQLQFCNLTSLPVTLSDFRGATKADCHYELNWETAREEGFSHYELERSFDGRSFTSLGQIKGGKAGYRFVDKQSSQGAYYRLKMIDLDGSSAYSKVIRAEDGCKQQRLLSLHPNPVATNTGLTLSFAQALRPGTVLTVFGADGREVLRPLVGNAAGQRTLAIPTTSLPAGTYYLRVVDDGLVEVKAFVISR